MAKVGKQGGPNPPNVERPAEGNVQKAKVGADPKPEGADKPAARHDAMGGAKSSKGSLIHYAIAGKPAPLNSLDMGATTEAVGEEGGGGVPDGATTEAVGEEGGGGIPDGATTEAVGEEGGGGVPDGATTEAVGEEGGGVWNSPEANRALSPRKRTELAAATLNDEVNQKRLGPDFYQAHYTMPELVPTLRIDVTRALAKAHVQAVARSILRENGLEDVQIKMAMQGDPFGA